MKGQYDNLAQNFEDNESIAHATISADTTGSAVTLVGGPVLIKVYVSAAGTASAGNQFEFTVLQSNDGSTYAAATAASQYIVRDSWDRAIAATTETGWFVFQFIPVAGYYSIKVFAEETGTASITCSAHVEQGSIHQPVSS